MLKIGAAVRRHGDKIAGLYKQAGTTEEVEIDLLIEPETNTLQVTMPRESNTQDRLVIVKVETAKIPANAGLNDKYCLDPSADNPKWWTVKEVLAHGSQCAESIFVLSRPERQVAAVR